MLELDPVSKLQPNVYVGQHAKNKENGHGMMKYSNGELFKGHFKAGKRCGSGVGMLVTGALYKGDWVDDLPHGNGTLYSGEGEIVEGKFENGKVALSNKRIKILFKDGQYFEGSFSNHRRHGFGKVWYPNGDSFEGDWSCDKRVGRGKLRCADGLRYTGQFLDDFADGNCQIEDEKGNVF